jgi:thioredoxin 1
MLQDVNNKEFIKIIPQSYDKPILVYFWAPWVVGSTAFMPKVEKIAHSMRKVAKFVSIDTEENMDIVQKYKIISIPTVLIIKNEQIKHTLTGLIDESHIQKAIKKHI